MPVNHTKDRLRVDDPLETSSILGMRVVAYARVSTADQAGEGVSLAVQSKKLTAYTTATDLELVELVEDAGLSAKTLERPGLQRALWLLEQGQADGLLVLKLDRLTRSVRDLGELVETYFGPSSRWALLSVGDAIDTRSAGGRLVLNVLASVAQWEREIIGERTREALAHLKTKGVRLGPPSLGSVASERSAVERVLELRRQGLSLAAVAEVMQAEGHPTKRGLRWAPETVRRVCEREGLPCRGRVTRVGTPLQPNQIARILKANVVDLKLK